MQHVLLSETNLVKIIQLTNNVHKIQYANQELSGCWRRLQKRANDIPLITVKYHSVSMTYPIKNSIRIPLEYHCFLWFLNGTWLAIRVLCRGIYEWHLNGFLNDILNYILNSLYRSVILNGILNYRWEYHWVLLISYKKEPMYTTDYHCLNTIQYQWYISRTRWYKESKIPFKPSFQKPFKYHSNTLGHNTPYDHLSTIQIPFKNQWYMSAI